MSAKKLLLLTILLEIAVGLLGELMPDGLKSNFNDFCCEYLHTQSQTAWYWLVGLSIVLLLYFSLKNEEAPAMPPAPNIEVEDSKNVNTGGVNTGGGDFRLGDN
jgi:hypothetical protein